VPAESLIGYATDNKPPVQQAKSSTGNLNSRWRPREASVLRWQRVILRSNPIIKSRDTFCNGAVLTAIKIPACFQSVPDDPTAAIGTSRRQFLNGAFKAVKNVTFVVFNDLETFVVTVSTCNTFTHEYVLCNQLAVSVHQLVI
jgi:hypothetical protein